MKRFILAAIVAALLMFGAAVAFQATSGTVYVPVWAQDPTTGQWGYSWPALGKTLPIQGGYIEALCPPPVTRVYGYRPGWDSTRGGYVVPVGAKNVSVWVNKFRYYETDDYLVKGDLVVPVDCLECVTQKWPPPGVAAILCDYDK